MALEIAADGGLTRPKFLDRLLRFRKITLILAFAVAFFYSQWCFHPINMEVTRISEHSLMPGLVTPRFDKSGVAVQIYRKLNELHKTKSQQQFILETFAEFGLQCFTQKWRSAVAANPMNGENVYGFVRGHRNDGAEAQLIVVQLGRTEMARRMIARMLAFVDFAKEQVYWARDFVIVFVDGGDGEGATEQAALALDAFLLKYQKIESISSEQSSRRSIEAEEIQTQTGALIAGVVYDLSGMTFKNTHIVNLETNGLNGQQVNLDVFNGIVKIADSKHSSRVAIYGTIHRHNSPYMDISPFTIPMKAIYTQAFTSIEGIHSIMGKYGVQGITVGLSFDFTERQAGQFIEEVSRMLNNVLERLHQSYFMYVLSDDMHFASVAFYMPVIGILLAPLVVSAYFEWTKLELFQMPFLYLIFHCLGFLIYASTTWIYANLGTDFALQWTNFPFFGTEGCAGQMTPLLPLIPTFILVLSAPIGLILFWKTPVQSVRSVRILCLLETSLIVGCLSLINFGLAFFTSAVVVPIVFLMTFESRQRARSFLRTAVLSFLSPIGLITYLAINVPDFLGISHGFSRMTDFGVAKTITHNLIKQHVLFGAHQFFLLCTVAYPVWNMLFACALHTDSEEGEEEEGEKEDASPPDPNTLKTQKTK
ncbi:unnamed protein product [Caenorhabditis sp. 36 PRJEB53466]|nr:unnamed protein product [Caenorhabditis sp. 36 PRJEB53466]